MMDGTERGSVEDFERQYRLGTTPARRQVEGAVLGTDYGATSYTTLAQAGEMARLLRLEPGDLLLDVGTGSGWPGLYVAASTGCRVVLTDQPVAGLRVARRRSLDDGFGDRCAVVVSSGERLPFRAGVFDAVIHTDVLC